jgi:exo-beta-1,3-glucanase (GH17 family)
VFNGWVTAGELASFIQDATSQLRGAGYTGIISTAETVAVYQDNPSLCDAVESYVHTNIHPYYDPGTTSSEAGSFVVSQKEIVEGVCSGKTVIVSETGWPSGGGSDGDAVASPSDQATAIAAINDATNGDVTFFSYGNDAWKSPGPEQYFGMNFLCG